MNDLIKRAMGTPRENPFSFMALLASAGGVPGMGAEPVPHDRAFFEEARAGIDAFAAEHRYDGYGFFDLMIEAGFMPRAAELTGWVGDAAEQTIAHVLGTPANENVAMPRQVPPQAA